MAPMRRDRSNADGPPKASIPDIWRGPMRLRVHALDLGQYRFLDLADARLVAPVECPLLDTLGAQQSSLGQHFEVLAHRRLAHAQLFGDQHTTDAVLDQVAVDLRPEMRLRVFQPLQDEKPPPAGERAHGRHYSQIANFLITYLMSSVLEPAEDAR